MQTGRRKTRGRGFSARCLLNCGFKFCVPSCTSSETDTVDGHVKQNPHGTASNLSLPCRLERIDLCRILHRIRCFGSLLRGNAASFRKLERRGPRTCRKGVG